MIKNDISFPNTTGKVEKSKNYQLLSVVLFTTLFSNAVLRSEDNLLLYIGISILVIIYAIIRGLLKPSRFSKTIISGVSIWAVLLFFMYFFYGIVLTKYGYFNTKFFLFMLASMLVTVLLFVDIPINKMMKIFIKECAIASVAIVFFILLNEWSLIIEGGTRIGESGSGNVNTIAIYLGMMSVPCLYMIVFEKRIIYAIPYTLSIALMLLTGSKKALLLIVLSLLILTILKNKLKLHRYVPAVLGIILLLIFVFTNDYLYSIIGFRVIDFLNTIGFNVGGIGDSESSQLRLLMYELGAQAFWNHPLFGGGWFYFSVYSDFGTYSHNNYIELLVTYGLFGFIFYYGMFLSVLLKTIRIMKNDHYAKLIFTMIILILINDFAMVSFLSNVLNYQILILGYLYVNGTRREQMIQRNEKKLELLKVV